jgi:hypothetical protein
MIRATSLADSEALVQRLRKLATAAEVRAMVAEYVFSLTPPARKAKV